MTLHAQQIRLQRNEVKLEVKNAYNARKDFFISYTDAFLLECILTYFKMDELSSSPSAHSMPHDEGQYAQWVIDNFKALIRSNVGTFTYKPQTEKVADNAANAAVSIGNVYFLIFTHLKYHFSSFNHNLLLLYYKMLNLNVIMDLLFLLRVLLINIEMLTSVTRSKIIRHGITCICRYSAFY